MPAKKHNWDALKAEYMLWDGYSVKEFLENKFGTRTGQAATQATGWQDEKKERDRRVAERVMNEREEEEVKLYKKMLKHLMENRVATRIMAASDDELSAGDMKIFWQMLKTELGLPTSISQTHNLNEEVREDPNDLTEEELEKMDKAMAFITEDNE